MLKSANKARYLENGGVRCPFCDSDDLEGGFIEVDEGGACQEVRCLACERRWRDSYKLVDVEEIEEEKPHEEKNSVAAPN